MPETKKYLNRDGLEEYNSLLPHSSAEIQEYVDDWLDAHPEATTTVQDGSITTQKLADGSVTRNKLAADVAHLLGGMMVTGEVQGEILTADDAYSVAPLSVSIDGKSTQDGTPTPESPVPIDSIEVLELPVTFAGKNLMPARWSSTDQWTTANGWFRSNQSNRHTFYVGPNAIFTLSVSIGKSLATDSQNRIYVSGASGFLDLSNRTGRYSITGVAPENGFALVSLNRLFVTDTERSSYITDVQIELGPTATPYEPYHTITANIPMQGHVLRSLPDGTCDTMTLSYLRESDRSGWAWYSRELTIAVGRYDVNAFTSIGSNVYRAAILEHRIPANQRVYMLIYTGAGSAEREMSNMFTAAQTSSNYLSPNHFLYYAPSGALIFAFESGRFADLAAANAWLGENPLYVLMQLTTPTTETLDPIELPILPAPNYTVWSDPATGLKMSYMRDANIVVSNIEQAIADL